MERIDLEQVGKISRLATGADAFIDPEGVRYWNREALAYQTVFFTNLLEGLSSPKCYGVAGDSEQETWLWLEDIRDDLGEQWPEGYYSIVASHLGWFNGAYLAGEPLPGASCVGIATVGQELAPLVGMAIFEGDFSFEEVPVFIERVFNSYLEGLWEAGGYVEADKVRFCFLASWLYRYALGGLSDILPFLMDESNLPILEQVFRESRDVFLIKFAQLGIIFKWLYSEAERLLSGFEL